MMSSSVTCFRLWPGRRSGARWLAALLCSGAMATGLRAADAYRGLWVGEVTLTHVNEVSVPLDAGNVPRASDPKVPTATADQAHLRMILHVNGAGEASLLRDVALLRRDGEGGSGTGDSVLRSESEVALVTDARLYAEFPAQPAMRWATAVFDFGDSEATGAVDWLVEAAVAAAAASVAGTTADLTTAAGRFQATTAAAADARTAAEPRVAAADASARFSQFLAQHWTRATVNAIAAAADPAGAAGPARAQAAALRDGSFYRDTRGIEAVDAVVGAVLASAAGAKTAAAQNMAAAYADVADDYHRFLAGKSFGAMITGAATAAAGVVAGGAGADEAAVRAAVDGNAAVRAARSEAVTLRVSAYDDRRASVAVEQVLDAIVTAALAEGGAEPGGAAGLALVLEQEGWRELANEVVRYPRPTRIPSLDYDGFVRSADFRQAVATAAQAAAEGAVAERRNNPPPFSTQESMQRAAKASAITALRLVYVAAAAARLTALPLAGGFGPGVGDPRLTASVGSGDAPLGPAGLQGTLRLPANHPTNPFRHRRHPDHPVGFEVTRHLRLDFDGAQGDVLPRAGFGVDRITGTYREEIMGLHKPLGPARDVGLRVEGRFELQRLSLIDTLNAR